MHRLLFFIVFVALQIILPISSKSQHFTNKTPIKIKDKAPASLFPSTIGVFGLDGFIKEVTITMEGACHQNYNDVQIILQGPEGQSILLQNGISKQGGRINKVVYTFKDGWPNMPSEKEITSSFYKPTQYEEFQQLTYPAPKSNLVDGENGFAMPGPYMEEYTSLTSVFGGRKANGLWKLFVQDMKERDEGIVLNGWSLDVVIETYDNKPNPENSITPLLASNDFQMIDDKQMNIIPHEMMLKVASNLVTASEATNIEPSKQREIIELSQLTTNDYKVEFKNINVLKSSNQLILKTQRPIYELDYLQTASAKTMDFVKEKTTLNLHPTLLVLKIQRPIYELDYLQTSSVKTMDFAKEKTTLNVHPTLLVLKTQRPTYELDYLQTASAKTMDFVKEKTTLNLHPKLFVLKMQRPIYELDYLQVGKRNMQMNKIEKHTWNVIANTIPLNKRVELNFPNEKILEEEKIAVELPTKKLAEIYDHSVVEAMESLAKKFDPSLEDVKFQANQKMREAYLILKASENEICTIKIFDATGVSKLEQKYKMHNGINSIYISTGKLDAGKYNLIYEFNTLSGIVKFEQ